MDSIVYRKQQVLVYIGTWLLKFPAYLNALPGKKMEPR